MTARIFALLTHKGGVLDDNAGEFIAAAKKLDAAAAPVAVVCANGAEREAACNTVPSGFSETWKLEHSALAYPNAELVRQALVNVVPGGSIVLVAHDHFGIDLAPGLSIKLKAAFVPDVVSIESLNGTQLNVVRQELGGQVSAHVRCDISSGAVISIRPGTFKAAEAAGGAPAVVDKSAAIGELKARRRYLQTIAAEPGDVDITKHAILVSVGRGIQEKDNIAIAQELADSLGGAVSCSRPVVDAKWLEKSRQVGSSGKTVKPKVYLACGISGSFQHLAGIKGNPLIIAINKNPKAPIFQAAQVGIVANILEFLPELTAKLNELRCATR